MGIGVKADPGPIKAQPGIDARRMMSLIQTFDPLRNLA
jgi:hypothetical protein